MKNIITLILGSFLLSQAIDGMHNQPKNKKRKEIERKTSDAKRRKLTPDPYLDPYSQSTHVVCQHCGTEWLAQTDECPGCGNSTGLGNGHDVINHKYFLPKK